MTIAAKMFLTCVVLLVVVTAAALVDMTSGISEKWKTFFGCLLVVVVIVIPASGIAWIWGW